MARFRNVFSVVLMVWALLTALFTFQNCGQPGISMDSGASSGSVGSSGFPTNTTSYGAIPSVSRNTLPNGSRAPAASGRANQGTNGVYFKGY